MRLIYCRSSNMGIQERKEREKERRRSEITDAAEIIIFANGIEKAKVEDIAEQAELSKATLYLYFHNKEEIYFAISMRGQKIMLDMVEKAILSVTEIRAKILSFLKTMVQFKETYPDYFNAVLYFLTNKIQFEGKNVALHESRMSHEKYLNLWIDLIQKGKQEGVIRTELNEVNTVLLLWMQLMGFLRIYSVIEENLNEMFHIKKENMMNEYFELILQGVVK
ncbi:MAG TPA: TetR/AcrR family transcriptional regulator [Bacteroidetes bacterium]|nr:TetR/AcrR family transcriptional regulator [Bacteroidota bacterium]